MFSTIAELRTWKVAQIAWDWEAFQVALMVRAWPRIRHGSDLIQHHQQRLEIWMKWSINFKVYVRKGFKIE